MKITAILIFILTASLSFSQQPNIIPIGSDLNFYTSDTLSINDAKKISKLAYIYCDGWKPKPQRVVQFEVYNGATKQSAFCIGEFLTDSAKMIITPNSAPYILYLQKMTYTDERDTSQITYKKIVIIN